MERSGTEIIRHFPFEDGSVITFVGEVHPLVEEDGLNPDIVAVTYGWACKSRKDAWNRKKGIRIARGRHGSQHSVRTVLADNNSHFKMACLLDFLGSGTVIANNLAWRILMSVSEKVIFVGFLNYLVVLLCWRAAA